jgi:hypothetical protein
MSPDAWFALGGMLITFACLCIVLWRGFKIETLPVFLFSAKLPAPIEVPPKGVAFRNAAPVFALCGLAVLVWASYAKWLAPSDDVAASLPPDRHFKLSENGELFCDRSNVDSLTITPTEWVTFFVSREGESSSSSGVRAEISMLSVEPLGYMVHKPNSGREWKCYPDPPLPQRTPVLDKLVQTSFAPSISNSKCSVHYRYVHYLQAEYQNFSQIAAQAAFQHQYFSSSKQSWIRRVNARDTVATPELELELRYDATKPAGQKYSYKLQKELENEVLKRIARCNAGEKLG